MTNSDKLIQGIEFRIFNIQYNDMDIFQILSQPPDNKYKIEGAKIFEEAKNVIENYLKANINSQSKYFENLKINIEEINLEYEYSIESQLNLEKRELVWVQIFNPEEALLKNTLPYISNDPWVYPNIDMELGNKSIRLFHPEQKLECKKCKGSGLCEICHGKEMDCDKCQGKGDIDCTDSNCYNGDCGKCAGKGYYICSFCGGSGILRDGRRCNCPGGKRDCSMCNRTGKCQKCRGKAKVQCPKCQGKKKQNCKVCVNNSGKCTICKGNGCNYYNRVLKIEFTKIEVNDRRKDYYSHMKFFTPLGQQHNSSLDFYNSSRKNFLNLSSMDIIESEKLFEHLPIKFIKWLKNQLSLLYINENVKECRVIKTIMQFYILPKYTIKYKINDDSYIFNSFSEDFSSGIVFNNSIIESLREETKSKIINNISNRLFEQAISEAEDYLNTIQNDLTIKNLLLETKIKKELILFEELYNKNKLVNIIKRFSRLDKIISQNEKILSYYQSCKLHIAQRKSAINILFMLIPAIHAYLLVTMAYDEIIVLTYYVITIGLFRIVVHLYFNKVNPTCLSTIMIAIICFILATCGFIFVIFLFSAQFKN